MNNLKTNDIFLPELNNLPEPKKFWETTNKLNEKYFFYGYKVNTATRPSINYKYKFIGTFLKEGEKITDSKKREIAIDIRQYLLLNTDNVDSLEDPFWDGGKKFKEAKNKFFKKV